MIVLFCTIVVNGQSVEEIKSDRTRYLWGEGKGNTLKKADSEALSDLINQISTTVESNFTLLQQEKGIDDFSETFQSVIHTYSSATLNNTERIVVGDEPDVYVLRYMLRSEINRVFAARKAKVLEYAEAAVKAETNYQMADALRYYYWSQTLLRSLPEGETIRWQDENGEERLLSTWLPLQINTLFSGLNVTVVRVTKEDTWQEVELSVTYQGQPVRNFDYTYWDGRDWSNIVSAKDGRGVAELPEVIDVSKIRLRGEYVCEGEAIVDAELRDVLSKLDVVPYRSCYLTVHELNSRNAGQRLRQTKKSIDNSVVTDKRVDNLAINSFFVPSADSIRYLTVIKQVENAIRTQHYDAVRDCFTAVGYEMFTRLINYGRARIYGSPVYRVIKTGDVVLCRSLPLSFSFRNSNRTFVEDVVFEFTADAKIAGLSFGLSSAALKDIVSKKMWGEQSRMTLIRFLENYKTAYALKRLD